MTSEGEEDGVKVAQFHAPLRYPHKGGGATMALFALLFVASLVVSGCDPSAIIIAINRTSVPVKISNVSVPVDYEGLVKLPNLAYYTYVVQASEEMKFVTEIYPKRNYGSERKYNYYAVNLSGEVVFQRMFTWDELDSQDWKVVIEPGVGVDQVRRLTVVNETAIIVSIDNRGGKEYVIAPSSRVSFPVVFVGEAPSFYFRAWGEDGNVVYDAQLDKEEIHRQDWTIVVK